MQRRILSGLLLAGLALTAAATKYAGEFEELGASARAVGIGSAFVAVAGDPSSIYYNPAATGWRPARQVLFMHAENFGGLVKNDFLGGTFAASTGGLGLALYHTGVPDIPITELPDPDRPPSDSNRPGLGTTVTAADWVAYFNYGRPLLPRLWGGANLKMIYRTLGVGSCFGMGLDLGLIAEPVPGLVLGARVRNASTAPLLWTSGRQETVVPRAALGAAREFRFGLNRLLVSVEGDLNFEGLTGPALVQLGPVGLEPDLGLEFTFRDFLSARLGSHAGRPALGVGGRYRQFYLDYAWSSAAELGSIQKISGGVRF